MISPFPILAAALLALLGGVAAVVQKRRSLASWSFCAGMLILALETVLGGAAQHATDPHQQARWRSYALVAQSLAPAWWLCFSLVYSRGDARETLRRSRLVLVLALLLPVGLALGFRDALVRVVSPGEGTGQWVLLSGPVARALSILLLVAAIGVLVNLERTFRAAVGTVRWRIKYVFVGVGLIFGAKIYTLSQDLLFSRFNPNMVTVQAVALLLGCGLLTIAYLRKGFSDLDIYPSRGVLRNSLTIVLAGAYLLGVGVFAQVVVLLGGIEGFQAKAFLILLAIVGLAVLVLSDRLRFRLSQFVTRHFKRPEHDYRKVWTRTTESLSSQVDRSALCGAAARVISETCRALSVSVFVVDEHVEALKLEATTAPDRDGGLGEEPMRTSLGDPEVLEGLRGAGKPVDLEALEDSWARALRDSVRSQFARGGDRLVVPLIAADRLIGMIGLADRVNGEPYTGEELELLGCIGNQVAAGLLNLRLNEELMRAKELEAFQTVSTFFVHDMKNAANGLNLMLQNLPVHFDDPAFREDALRAIGKTVTRINELTERLSSLRKRLELRFEEGDLNELIEKAVKELPVEDEIEIVQDLQPLQAIKFDREQIRTVLTNLVVNAREAVGKGGRVVIGTKQRNGSVLLSVQDNGCGMDPEFVRNELFRPFRSTKSKGLGIGMFQSRMIVEAHRGSIRVRSNPEEGTSFQISLPTA